MHIFVIRKFSQEAMKIYPGLLCPAAIAAGTVFGAFVVVNSLSEVGALTANSGSWPCPCGAACAEPFC